MYKDNCECIHSSLCNISGYEETGDPVAISSPCPSYHSFRFQRGSPTVGVIIPPRRPLCSAEEAITVYSLATTDQYVRHLWSQHYNSKTPHTVHSLTATYSRKISKSIHFNTTIIHFNNYGKMVSTLKNNFEKLTIASINETRGLQWWRPQRHLSRNLRR